MDRVIADLYFTFPFDLGIVDGGEEIFAGEPYEVDREVAELCGAKADYLNLIQQGKGAAIVPGMQLTLRQ